MQEGVFIPKGSNQKLKLSYLCKIMQEKTDDEHSLTLQQIIHELEANDISAERKSLYDDFKCMDEHLGIEVIKEQKGRETYLRWSNEEFIKEMEILLVIDMQQKYMDNYEPDLLDRVNVRIHEAVDAGMPVVYVRNVGKLENEEKYVLAEGLDVVSEYVFAKRWPSAFSSEEFVQFIERMQVDAINMVGVDGRCCVARSVLDAKKKEYEVRLYLDAVAATNDNFYIKELPEMQEAGIVIVSD